MLDGIIGAVLGIGLGVLVWQGTKKRRPQRDNCNYDALFIKGITTFLEKNK